MFNVRLTEFRWQSVPKLWTSDSEAPFTESGVRSMTCDDRSWWPVDSHRWDM